MLHHDRTFGQLRPLGCRQAPPSEPSARRYDGGHAPDGLGRGAAPDLHRGRAGPPAPRGRASAQRARGDRAHLRRDVEAARAGATYADVEAAGRAAVDPTDVMRRRARACRRGPARGPDGRRDATGRAAWIRSGGGVATAPDGPGRDPAGDARALERRTREPIELDRPERVAARRPGLVALPVRPGQRPARCSIATAADGFRLDLPAGRVDALGARRDEDGRPAGPVRRGRGATDERASPRTSGSPATARRTGDRVRLGDTDLWVRVAEDRQAPGDEPIWGYAKTIRAPDDAGPRRPVGARRRRGRRGRPRSGRSGASRPTSASRTAGSSVSAGPGTPRSATGSSSTIGPHTMPIMGYGLIATPGAVDSHVHRDQPGAAAGGAVRRRDDAHHGRLRGAAVGDGADAGRARADGRSTSGSRPAPASEDDSSLEALARCRRVRLQDPRGLRRVSRADRSRPAVRRRARRRGRAAHRRPPRVGRARGHGRGDRRPDGPRLSRRGDAAAATCRTCSGSSARRTSSARRRRRPCPTASTRPAEQRPDDRPEPRGVVRRARTTSSWSASGSTPRRWPPRARSTNSGAIGDRQLRFAGDGPDHGDGPADDPARRRRCRRWRATEAGAGHPGLPADPGDPFDSTDRVLRYLAKVTIEPAIVHGISDARRIAPAGPARRHRPVEAGLVRGQAGARPQGGLSGLGAARRGQRDGRAAPSRPATGRTGAVRAQRRRACPRRSCPRRGGGCGARRALGSRAAGRCSRSSGTRGLTRADLAHNRATAPIEIDPREGRVTLAGRPLEVARSTDLPLNRRYFLR